MAAVESLFCPFREVGLCSNSVPASVSARGTSILISTSVGKSFNVYEGDKLHLLFTSSRQTDDIDCIVQDRRCTYVSCNSFIKCYKRGRQLVWSFQDNSSIQSMILIGDFLVFINANNMLKVLSVRTRDIISEINFIDEFTPSNLLHPSTYLNKVLIGSREGVLQLWNIRTQKLVYTFDGWGCSVTCLEQSTVLDIVGVGLSDGRIIIHNLRTNVSLMTFHQDNGPVTSLTFRKDGINTMISGSTQSDSINVWSLDHKKLDCMIQDAHSEGVHGCVFLPDQPLLITNSVDNSIKMWIFDQSDGSARLLKERRGHSAPPTIVRFMNPTTIISGGLDSSMRITSLHKDSQSREMSQQQKGGSLKVKGTRGVVHKPSITSDISFELLRSSEWDCIVSCHHGNHSAFTWSLSRYSIGSHRLTPLTKKAVPLCCCVSGCGNFTIIGTNTGDIEIFNIQSGLRKKQILKGHDGAVRGVAINNIGTRVYSCGSDGYIKVWSFYDAALITSVTVGESLAKMCYNSDSSLLAVSSDKCAILLLDMATVNIVRKFKGHHKRITDMCFSNDGRWLLSCSMDCSIITWDLPSGQILDSFIIEAPPTSISLSPTGEYLACSIVDELGIHIWSNSSLYDVTPSQIMSGEGSSVGVTSLSGDDLITLSGLPRSQWMNITQLDVIKERNKPVEPPKPIAPAPFFIPTVPGLEMNFSSSNDFPSEENEQNSRILQLNQADVNGSVIQQALTDANTGEGVAVLSDLFKGVGPSALDREIQLLSTKEHCTGLLKFILTKLQKGEDFELVESYLSLYLKYHQSSKFNNAELLQEVLTQHEKQWNILHKQLNTCLCLLQYSKHFSVY